MKPHIFLLIALGFFWTAAAMTMPRPRPQDEGTAAACDNSGAKNTASRVHDCDCNRAKQECKNGETAQQPMAGCKTYCKEDACDCTTESCSHT